MDTILVVEDNKDVNQMLAEVLVGNGYQVEQAYNGVEACKRIRSREFSLVLLDLMLPYKCGEDILTEVRSLSRVPVIVISAKDQMEKKLQVLQAGADDYITKPFDISEVVVRVATVLRRRKWNQGEQEEIVFRELKLDTKGKRAFVQDKELELTPKEFQILEILMMNQSKVFSRAQLFQMIWQEDAYGDENAVKTHMSNLRTKLKEISGEKEYIETVWGLGYRLKNQS